MDHNQVIHDPKGERMGGKYSIDQSLYQQALAEMTAAFAEGRPASHPLVAGEIAATRAAAAKSALDTAFWMAVDVQDRHEDHARRNPRPGHPIQRVIDSLPADQKADFIRTMGASLDGMQASTDAREKMFEESHRDLLIQHFVKRGNLPGVSRTVAERIVDNHILKHE
jgi:hypothetical protein